MISLPRLASGMLAVTLLAASFSLFSAVPRVVAPAVAAHLAPFDVVEAEIQTCQSDGRRDYAQCEAEVEGKALIRDAELALASPDAPSGRFARTRVQ